jgi:ABC-type iron transport system FetAB ATPase subunit
MLCGNQNQLSTHPGIPEYRTRVLYVPQRPALLPGSPRDFFETIHRFKSRQNVDDAAGTIASHVESAASIAENWGIEAELWDRSWASLSGGEAQRMALVIALGIKGTEVLLLDGEWFTNSEHSQF